MFVFPYSGEIAGLLTAVCWAVSGLAFEDCGRRIGSLSVNILRLGLGFVFLAIASLALRGLALPTDASSDAWLWLSISGLVGFTLGDMCLFRAYVLIGARLSLLLLTLVPPMVAVIGWMMLGENLSLKDWTAMALVVGGVLWVVAEKPNGKSSGPPKISAWGITLGVFAALAQALGLILSKKGMGDYNALAATQIRVIAGFCGFALLFVFVGWWPKVIASTKNGRAMSTMSIGAFFGPFLGVTLSLASVQNTQAGVAATLMGLVPIVIIPLEYTLKKQRTSLRAVSGTILAVAGTALLFVGR
jgi:drug/metabolite transporter (DMT)-like permease